MGKGNGIPQGRSPMSPLQKGSLTAHAKVWFYFICSVILPSKHLSTIREKEAVLLYAILKGYKFSVGKIIENSILGYYRGSDRGLVPLSNTNHKVVHFRRCGKRLGRRRDMS